MTTTDSVQQLQAAFKGFDHLFNNDVVQAKAAFAADGSPFHLVGMAACVFLEAALGLEVRYTAIVTVVLPNYEIACSW